VARTLLSAALAVAVAVAVAVARVLALALALAVVLAETWFLSQPEHHSPGGLKKVTSGKVDAEMEQVNHKIVILSAATAS
jgi:hypothetical protein